MFWFVEQLKFAWKYQQTQFFYRFSPEVKDLSVGEPWVVIDGLLGNSAKVLAQEADVLESASKLLPLDILRWIHFSEHFENKPSWYVSIHHTRPCFFMKKHVQIILCLLLKPWGRTRSHSLPTVSSSSNILVVAMLTSTLLVPVPIWGVCNEVGVLTRVSVWAWTEVDWSIQKDLKLNKSYVLREFQMQTMLQMELWGQEPGLEEIAPRLTRFATVEVPALQKLLRAAVPELGLAEIAPHVKLQLTTGEAGKGFNRRILILTLPNEKGFNLQGFN